jgi:hypothetical protein
MTLLTDQQMAKLRRACHMAGPWLWQVTKLSLENFPIVVKRLHPKKRQPRVIMKPRRQRGRA